ncbi:MAG: hypothetical protein SFX72_10805 [Isosphaeraceae bacterium]|nr:hypothetical protein [Isosphaeraceae bacterium]
MSILFDSRHASALVFLILASDPSSASGSVRSVHPQTEKSGSSIAQADEPQRVPQATRMRHVSARLIEAQPPTSTVDVVGVDRLPIALEVRDEVGGAGDVDRFSPATRRALRVCVLVRPESKPGEESPPAVVEKYLSGTLEAPAGTSRTHTVKGSVALAPGDYRFQVLVCDPQSKADLRKPASRFSWLPADDPFLPGQILSGRSYRLRVVPAPAKGEGLDPAK